MKIYRFEKIEEKRCEAIANNKLWLSRPSSFNDLNDCRIPNIYVPRFSTTERDNWFEIFNILYPKNINVVGSLLSRKIVDCLREFIFNEEPDRLSLTLDRTSNVGVIRQEIIKSTGVCCFFSGDCKEPLMWAHYADNHKGFCVEYEYMDSQDAKVFPVTYSSRISPTSALEIAFCPNEALTRILTSKTLHWQYEKEYRFVHFGDFSEDEEHGRLIDVPSYLVPNRIITGAKMNREMLPQFDNIGLDIISHSKFIQE